MFGSDKTYFAGSPVVIEISGLQWPGTSPFNIVQVEVIHNDKVAGFFRQDSGGQSRMTLDIQKALRAIWSDYDFSEEVAKAQDAAGSDDAQSEQRAMRQYSLRIVTEYISSDGVFTRTECEDSHGNKDIPGGQCLIGRMTEWERSLVTDPAKRDVSALEHTGVRNGDASTKPISSPELVGRDSITSWVDVQSGYTKSIFYPAPSSFDTPGITGESDDVAGRQQGWTGHEPIVLRDDVPYTDFLFKNRRGAIETCSAQMLESMDIGIETTQYSHVEKPSFSPSYSLMSVVSGGRRSWPMSSGSQTREWAEWWTTEFLMAGKWWMLYKGRYVPVTVEPAKKSITIYDRAKQQMPSVEFTVTLALEG